MRLVSAGLPYDAINNLSYAEKAAYHKAVQRLVVDERVNMYQAVMLTKCDPEKHEEIITGWYDALTETPTSSQKQSNATSSKGYSVADYMRLIGGG